MKIEFTVHGKPQPQGSIKAFTPKGWTRPILTSDNKTLKPWRQDVATLAQIAMAGAPLEMGPVSVTISFWFSRPKSTKKSVIHKITKPDLDKLQRAAYDAMTGIVYKDDSQIVENHNFKTFQDAEGALITVESLS